MKNIAEKILKFSGRMLKIFILGVLESVLDTSKKEYEPTQHEIMCGEKMSFSDKYFVPDEKHNS